MLHDLCYLALLLAHLVWVRYQGGEVDNDDDSCDDVNSDDQNHDNMNEGTAVSVHDEDALMITW